jgi:hypothetical protein
MRQPPTRKRVPQDRKACRRSWICRWPTMIPADPAGSDEAAVRSPDMCRSDDSSLTCRMVVSAAITAATANAVRMTTRIWCALMLAIPDDPAAAESRRQAIAAPGLVPPRPGPCAHSGGPPAVPPHGPPDRDSFPRFPEGGRIASFPEAGDKGAKCNQSLTKVNAARRPPLASRQTRPAGARPGPGTKNCWRRNYLRAAALVRSG